LAKSEIQLRNPLFILSHSLYPKAKSFVFHAKNNPSLSVLFPGSMPASRKVYEFDHIPLVLVPMIHDIVISCHWSSNNRIMDTSSCLWPQKCLLDYNMGVQVNYTLDQGNK